MYAQNLSFADKQDLMSSFPNIKLCYDNIIHNKVENVTKNIDFWAQSFVSKPLIIVMEVI
jgi:hypothetical protein